MTAAIRKSKNTWSSDLEPDPQTWNNSSIKKQTHKSHNYRTYLKVHDNVQLHNNNKFSSEHIPALSGEIQTLK